MGKEGAKTSFQNKFFTKFLSKKKMTFKNGEHNNINGVWHQSFGRKKEFTVRRSDSNAKHQRLQRLNKSTNNEEIYILPTF